MNDLVRSMAGLVAGAVLGWAGNGLTVIGRVDALERSFERIEQRLDEVVRRLPAAPDVASR